MDNVDFQSILTLVRSAPQKIGGSIAIFFRSGHAPAWASVLLTCLLAVFAYGAWQEAKTASAIANQQLQAGQIAFIFLRQLELRPDTSNSRGEGLLWWVFPDWENSGNTPGTDIDTYANFATFENGMPHGEYLKNYGSQSRSTSTIGPHSALQSAHFYMKPSELAASPYFWGWITYRDIIQHKKHITRFCYEVLGWSGDPTLPFQETVTSIGDTSAPTTTNSAPAKNIRQIPPFKPIYDLCDEGNCRDEECAEQDARYGVKN